MPALQVCIECGSLSDQGRCPAHRKNTVRRGYGYRHRRARAWWAPRVESGGVLCARCGEPIEPGTAWDQGHPDGESRGGPEHAGQCNRSAGAKNRTF